MNEEIAKKILAELEAIKRLKIFEMLDAGVSQSKIAEALGTSQASVSRMMSKKMGDN